MVLNSKNIKSLLDWLFHFLSYTIILIILSILFKKTIYIDSKHFIIWIIIATSIIYLLNKTVKPILFWLTLPITGLTLGLFYPFLNVFVLKLVEIITLGHFAIRGIFMPFIVAICISCINFLVSEILLKPIFRRN